MRMNRKSIVVLVLCACTLFMAVGYSILMSELNINSSASITSTWDVRITGISSGTSVGSAYNIEEPSFTDTVAKFNVSLVNPGDQMTYTITIKNQGTLTAILNSIDITTSGTDAIVYQVTGLKDGDTLAPNGTKTVTVVALYNPNVVADPNERVKKLSVDLEWVQYGNQVISAKTYTIAYNANNGVGSLSNTTCTVGSSCTLRSNTFTRSGYVFLGWATTPTGSPVYNDGASVYNLTSGNKTVTLYATWGMITNYTTYGSYSFTAPVSGYYQLEVWGAQGGYRGTSSANGGKGGYAKGTIFLEIGATLNIYVGGDGNTGLGWNGGAASGCYVIYGCETNILSGGATDIRVGSYSVYGRVIVAGGGGSVGGAAKVGGAGGGLTGISTTQTFYDTTACSWTKCGQGGTQTAGGAGASGTSYSYTAGGFGYGGEGAYLNGGYGGAGGGGWYGGSGSVPDGGGDDDRGGGGGSGFVFTASATVPSGYSLGSEYYLTNTVILDGTSSSIPNPTGSGYITGKSGHGYARITQLTVK